MHKIVCITYLASRTPKMDILREQKNGIIFTIPLRNCRTQTSQARGSKCLLHLFSTDRAQKFKTLNSFRL